MRTLVLTALSLVMAVTIVPAQTLEITLGPASGFSFNTGATGNSANLTNIVRSEPLDIVLTTTPTVPNPAPAQVLPRAVALYIGVDDPTPTVFPEGPLFIDLAAGIAPFELFNSFVNPFDPFFGPPLQGATNTISITLAADLFPPQFPLPLPLLTFQALAEDLPGNPVLLSNPVRMQVVDPEVAGFALTITDVDPKAVTPLGNNRPQGPEGGGNVVTISGTNFLAQSDWVRFPPTITFGGVPSAQVAILDGQTLMAVVPPTTFPTMPPATAACLVDVVVANDPLLAPMGTPLTAPAQYLYLTGLTPVIAGTVMPNGNPEGGEPRTIDGSSFLDGLQVVFTSQTNPALTETLIMPAASAGAGGSTIDFTTPTFCTGTVDVQVINCDEQVSNVGSFTYDPIQPTLATGMPSVTTSLSLNAVTFIAISEAGTNLSLSGTGYLPPDSPLSASPNVPTGSFYATRVFLDGVLEPGLAPPAGNRTTIAGLTQSFSSTGVFRPELGFKELRIENPPCVNVGNTTPISNPPCPPLTPPCTAVVQDDSPPTVIDVFPSIAVTSGGTEVEIRGQNFFSVVNGTTTQNFASFANPSGEITNIDPTALQVPAVLFGTRFATEVEVIATDRLRVRVPAAMVAAGTSTVPVTVFNPDTQSASASQTFTYVPPLTDPTRLLNPAFPRLDPVVLELIARGVGGVPTVIPGGGPGTAPALAFAVNPSPSLDRAQDSVRGIAVSSTASYSYIFLFNTLDGDPMSPTGGTRLFEFDRIEFPATITLSQPGVAFVPPIDPTLVPITAPGSTVSVPAGIPIRVIVKAAAYSVGPNGRLVFDNAQNPPLVLMSHDDLVVDAFVDLSGDAFYTETTALQVGATFGGPFRVRVDRTFPPAGAGQGGRGGAFFPEGLVQLPGPNFGVGPGALSGGSGFSPGTRFMIPPPGVQTEGIGGLGAAPIGVQSGAGGGGGYTTAGLNGMSGTAPGGSGGLTFGNTSNGPAIPGAPTDDRLIFGAAGIDYLGFANQSAPTTGLFYGGSGGGGGGGGLAIFVPALTLGGRGGNGGGCLVMISNRLLILGPGGLLFAQGEIGQLGVDAFPVYNSDPVIPVNLPGSGGSGSGGTIYGLAVADVCFAYGTSTVCPGVGGLTPPMMPVVDTRGGIMGPFQVGSNPGVQPGGAGGEGRIRFAIAGVSPYVSDFTADLSNLFNAGLIAPTPPAFMTIPPAYFSFPLP